MNLVNTYLSELKTAIDAINHQEIEEIVSILRKAREHDNSIYIIGNGGSATTASHFACDLGKGTIKDYSQEKERFRVYSLTDNMATLTAFGNDMSYDDIFVEPLKNLLRPKDVLISITGSGNSKNILKAIEYANSIGAISIGFLGFDGGKATSLLEHKVVINSHNYGIVEDLHLSLQHIISQKLKEEINKIH